MTPCCFSSCCYECLKSYLTSSHKLASSRAGVCPIAHCPEQDIFVQDLIPNHALNRAADWFIRQRISLMDEVTLEVKNEDKPEDIREQVVSLGNKLIEDAKAQAESTNTKHDPNAESILNVGGAPDTVLEGPDQPVTLGPIGQQDPLTTAAIAREGGDAMKDQIQAVVAGQSVKPVGKADETMIGANAATNYQMKTPAVASMSAHTQQSLYPART